MNYFNLYKGLRREIYIVSLAQLINKLGTFVFPFLTIYLTQKKELDINSVGYVLSLILCCSLVGSITGGKLADKFGRKSTYIIFQSLAGMLLIPCTFVDNTLILIMLIGLSNFSYSAVVPTLSAMVADILTTEDRQAGYSLLYLCSNVGAVLGPIIGMALYNSYTSLIFLVDGISCLIAVSLVCIYVKDISRKQVEEKSLENNNHKQTLFKILKEQSYFIGFFLIFIVFTVVYTQKTFSLPLVLDDIFLSKGSNIYGTLMSISAITVCILTPIITNLTKKINSLINITFSGLIFALGFGILNFINTIPIFIIAIIVITIGEILLMNNLNVFIANNSPQRYIGRLCSFISVCWSIGSMIGTSFVGAYIKNFDLASVWILISALAIFSSISMYFCMGEFRKRDLKGGN